MKATMTKLITIEAAAEILAVSRATTQRLIDTGRLPAITITRGRRKRLQRIDEADLQSFVQSLKSPNKDKARVRLERVG